jgi:hypothetical protein
MALTKTEARKIMLGVNGMSEGKYFGKPAIFLGEDFVGRVHDKEEAIALRISTIEMRDVMLEAEPKLFYITEHYRAWPMLLARLSALTAKSLKELVAARVREIETQPKKKKRAIKKIVKKKK